MEFTPSSTNVAAQPNGKPKVDEHQDDAPTQLVRDLWHLLVDGSSNHQGSTLGLILINLDDSMREQSITLGFRVSSNEEK